MVGNLEEVPTKSVGEVIAKRVRQFLRAFVGRHCYDPSKPSGKDQGKASRILGISQGYISDLMNNKKTPNLRVIIALREATGASFEEITGHRAPLHPRFPMGLLASDDSGVADAVEEGLRHERASSSGPAAPRIKRTPR